MRALYLLYTHPFACAPLAKTYTKPIGLSNGHLSPQSLTGQHFNRILQLHWWRCNLWNLMITKPSNRFILCHLKSKVKKHIFLFQLGTKSWRTFSKFKISLTNLSKAELTFCMSNLLLAVASFSLLDFGSDARAWEKTKIGNHKIHNTRLVEASVLEASRSLSPLPGSWS